MYRCKGGLQLIRPDCGRRKGVRDQRRAFGDHLSVPEPAVLARQGARARHRPLTHAAGRRASVSSMSREQAADLASSGSRSCS